jgi:hypothetical protein
MLRPSIQASASNPPRGFARKGCTLALFSKPMSTPTRRARFSPLLLATV